MLSNCFRNCSLLVGDDIALQVSRRKQKNSYEHPGLYLYWITRSELSQIGTSAGGLPNANVGFSSEKNAELRLMKMITLAMTC